LLTSQDIIKAKIIVFLFLAVIPFAEYSTAFAAEFSDTPLTVPKDIIAPEYSPEENDPASPIEDELIEDPFENFPPFSTGSFWTWDTSLSLGAGYKKNILYSSIHIVDDPFLRTQADATLFGLWTDDQMLICYFDFENNHYFSQNNSDDENVVMTQIQYQKSLSPSLHLGLSGGYSYFYMFFDTSISDLEQDTTLLKEHLFEFSPFLEKEWDKNWGTDANLRLIRNVYGDSVDNSTEFEPEFGLSYAYGHDSKVRLSYTWNRNDYDDRNAKTPAGEDVVGKTLLRKSHQMKLRSKHALDAQKMWTFQTDLGVTICKDNYKGYDDYNRIRASERISFERGNWATAIRLAVSRYDVGNRTIPEDNIDYTTTTGNFEVSRSIKPNWTIFLESEHEIQRYEEFENYTVTTVLLGVRWQESD
jgi:hypothetical protein